MANFLTTVATLFIFPWFIACTPFSVDDKDPSHWNQIARESIDVALRLKHNNKIARNVILFLGDGMSIPTLSAARIYKGQSANRRGEEEFLEFEKFPNVALIKTYNYDRQVPDSAGTATAFLSGIKANYETIGLNAHSRYNDCSSVESSKVKSIADWAQEAGKDAGVVTTTAITHATPAALYAHAANRDWEGDNNMTPNDSACKDIARQLVEDLPGRKLKVIYGGGRQHFLPEVKNDDSKPYGVRLDGRNLIDAWLDARNKDNVTHKYVQNRLGLNLLEQEKPEFSLGLFANRHMTYESDRNKGPDGEPSLSEMTTSAIKILDKNPKGYFLLVEGGRIDHAHHDSLARHALQETLAMDEAIMNTLQLVNPEETLVLVTADHAHVMTFNGYPKRGNDILGIGDTSDVDLLPYTTLMYMNGPGYNVTDSGSRHNITTVDTRSYTYKQFSGIPRLDETHGGDDVALYARGPMAHLFHGLQEQHYIAHVMAYASCIGPYVKDCARPSDAHINFANIMTVILQIVLIMMYRTCM